MLSVSNSLQQLTNNNKKVELYQMDPYFRDSLDDLFEAGFTSKLNEYFNDIAIAIFRPDSFVTHHVLSMLEKIDNWGFKAIYSRSFEYCRFKIRECWKYQLNIATRERVDVMDRILINFPGLYVVFKRTRSNKNISATEYLSSLKGPSNPYHRKPNQLRYSDTVAQVSVLTFVHIADEPIDIIREMGAYFDSKQRKKIINAISKSQERNITDDVRKILNRYQYNSLKYDSVKTDIYSLLSQASKQCAKGIFSSLENGMIDWRRAILQLERIYKPQNVWLFNAIAAHFAQTHVSSIDPIISDIGGENAEYQCKR